MKVKPFIAHSELTNEIYIVSGKEKYLVTEQAVKAVKAIKALEKEPNTGHWIGIDEEPYEDYECNKCGYVVSTFTANIEPYAEYKYCPNCGAKMESEDNKMDEEDPEDE